MSNIHRCCTWRYIKHVFTCIQLQAIPVSTIAISVYFTSTHSSTTYWQFAIIEYVLIQQLYFSNKYRYTHKASAIILTRIGTAFINLCPTSVSSPSWCTITLVTVHHVLGYKGYTMDLVSSKFVYQEIFTVKTISVLNFRVKNISPPDGSAM